MSSIVIRDGRAAGVVVRRHGQETLLRGGEVVLCAGSLVTPHLLQVSGIGSRADLERLGIPVVVDAPVAGTRFSGHPPRPPASSTATSPAPRPVVGCAKSSAPPRNSSPHRCSRTSSPTLLQPGPDVLNRDRALDEWINRNIGIAHHTCGTAPMGPDTENAVVDQYGRVHGVHGLRVADTSILSTAPPRGPAATAVLVGEVIAHAMCWPRVRGR
ncbi:GMC oxidoreductase [Streptomyces sp. NPDC003943]